MRLDKERILAVVATVLLHAVLLVVLVEEGSFRPQPNPQKEEESLPVVWIDPEVETPVPTPVRKSPPSVEKKVSRLLRGTKNDMSQARSPGDAYVREDQTPVVAGDDLWSSLPGSGGEDEAVPTGRFERDPLARRDPAMDAQASRLHVEVRDRSVGGWIQRQTRRSLCSDLKRQLGSAQGSSADTIVATMGRYGCKN